MSVEFIRMAKEFYALEAIDLMFSSFAQNNKIFSMIQGYIPFTDAGEMDCGKLVYSRYGIVTSRAKEKLLADFIAYREQFIKILEVALRDYLIVAMAGEARNARLRATRYSPSIPYIESRSKCMKNVLQYSPHELIATFEELYNPKLTRWDGSFGGKAWYSGVKALEIKDSVSFIDHCIDLQHNCGSMFNKSDYGLFTVSSGSELTDYLNFKRYASAGEILENYCDIWADVSAYLRNILVRAFNLGVIARDYIGDLHNGNSAQTVAVNRILDYTPLKFGKARLIEPIYSDENFDVEEYIDDSEEDNDDHFTFDVWIREGGI